jgi:multiple sugar transport system permease protein
MSSAAPSRRPWLGSPLQRREAIEGYLWIAPWVIGFLVFSLGPILASFYLSFTDYSIGGMPEWIGFANYAQAFFTDKLFWPSLGRTGYYAIATVVLGVALSLFAAMLLNQELRGKAFFRALYYLPSLTPVVAMAILWRWLLQPQVGLVNTMLGQVGIDG